jgi:hypothetical protein
MAKRKNTDPAYPADMPQAAVDGAKALEALPEPTPGGPVDENGVFDINAPAPEPNPALDMPPASPRYQAGQWGYVNGALVEIVVTFPDGFLARSNKGDQAVKGWEAFRPISQGALKATARVQKFWQDVEALVTRSRVDRNGLNYEGFRAYVQPIWLQLVDCYVAQDQANDAKLTGKPGTRRDAKRHADMLFHRAYKLEWELGRFYSGLKDALETPEEVMGVPVLKSR